MSVRLDKLLASVVGLLALTAVEARADAVRLEWSAPHGCPRVNEVRARVNARARALHLATESLFVRGEVRQERAGFRLKLSIEDAGHHAERELVSPSCTELVDALAWLVTIGALRPGAVRSDDSAAGRAAAALPGDGMLASQPAEATPITSRLQEVAPEQPTAPTPPVVAPAPASARAAEPMREPGRRRSHPWWYRTAVFAGLWSNDLPGPQAELAGDFGVGVGLLLIELRYSHLFARAQHFADDRAVRIQGQALRVHGCALFPAAKARARLGPCLGVMGLYSVAHARGIASPQRGTFFSFRGGIAAQASLRLLRRLELIAEAGLGLPLGARPGFTVAGYGEVARASRLSVQASLALGATW